jgi:hypothetical protein
MIRVGNASGFYGDRFGAMKEMLTGGPLDVLTGDYLAELTMLILGRDRAKDPATGYAKTFLAQLEQSLGTARDRDVRIVVNAGGLNPAGLADKVAALAKTLGLPDVEVGHVEGDRIDRPDALTANAYLGAFGIAACLRAGANVVVTGRVTDASLVVGAAIARYHWTHENLDALAGATVAGHVLECGCQATGGNFSFFTEIEDLQRPGFPIAEIAADGSSVITKHPGTGGAVTVETVTAQLLYEIDSPAYLGPDVTARFDTIRLRAAGADRVAISHVRGAPPPPTLKVGLNHLGGFRNAMTFVLTGPAIEAKADLVRRQLTAAVGPAGLTFTLARTDHPGSGRTEEASALLHAHLLDQDPHRAGRAFSQAAVELALASYPGCTFTGPPGDASPFGYFTADTIAQDAVTHLAVLPNGDRVEINPPRHSAPLTAAMAGADTAAGTGGPARHDAAADSGPPGDDRQQVPLARVIGARSGDKGGDANLGVWARTDAGYSWLVGFLTVERLRELLPETADLPIDRYLLPNLRAANFVIHGLLGRGVAASTRFDPQAKALGEVLRGRLAYVPKAVLS